MKKGSGKTVNRIMAMILASLFFCVAFFSVIFPVMEADHDCSGEDCPVCACIESCEAIQRTIACGLFVFAAIVFYQGSAYHHFFVSAGKIPFATPVSQKVRLNN